MEFCYDSSFFPLGLLLLNINLACPVPFPPSYHPLPNIFFEYTLLQPQTCVESSPVTGTLLPLANMNMDLYLASLEGQGMGGFRTPP